MIAATDIVTLAPGVDIRQELLRDAVRGHAWPLNASGAFVLARAGRALGLALWRGGDQAVIDGVLVNGSVGALGWFAGRARWIQSGFLYSYAFWMIVGLVLLLGWFLFRV